MKTLTQYVNDNFLYEGLSKEYQETFINEGIFSGLGKLFGWLAGKTQKAADNFVNGFETTMAGILAGKKSNDKTTKAAVDEFTKAVKECKDDKELLEKYKAEGEAILTKSLKDYEDPVWPISVKRQLANLGKTLKDDEALELSKKLDDAIKEKWSEKEAAKIEKTLDNTEKAIEKKAENEKKDTDDKKSDNDTEAVKKEAAEVIKEEKDIIAPLAKEAGLEGKYLLEYISKKIADNNKEIDPDSNIFKNLVRGMCICICGAIITENTELFAKIPEFRGLQELVVKELKKKVKRSATEKKQREALKEKESK